MIVGMDLFGSGRIEALQHLVKMTWPVEFGCGAKPFAEFFGTWRPGEEAVQKRTQIESGSADNHGHLPTGGNVVDCGARQLGIVPGSEGLGRFSYIEQVVRNAGALRRRWLGGADVEASVDGDGVATDDLAAEFFCERQR